MARYKITDPTTGRTAIVSGDTPPTDTDIDEIFASQPVGNKSENDYPVYDLAHWVPGLGQKVQSLREKDPEATKLAEAYAPFLGVAPVVSETKAVLPLLTKKGVGVKIGTKVAEATAKGVVDIWGDFATEARQEIAKRLGQGKEYKKILEERLASESPASLKQLPEITPQRLLDLRRQAANREPQGIFKMFQGKSPANQVDEIIRDVASRRLKEVTKTAGSDITGLDKLYSLYSKVGSPAQWAGRIAVGSVVKHSPVAELPVIGPIIKSLPVP
jgi:hypothetical protein